LHSSCRPPFEWRPGGDRSAHRAAVINRFRLVDHGLDPNSANHAASIRSALGVSVADAHLGHVIATATAPTAVVISDVDDVRRMADHLVVEPTVILL
jgi:hypothetical protein